MKRSRFRNRAIAAGLVSLVAWAILMRGPDTPASNPPGTFAFAVLGDAPYYAWEELQYRLVREDLSAHDLSWVAHVGDIFWRPCSDEMYRRHRHWFDALPHPVIYTPGDNEWTDCWEPSTGGYDPLERLHQIRQIFFDRPSLSLGGRRIALVSQRDRPEFPDLAENARWRDRGIIFATVHLVGSWNGRAEFPDRTAANDAESLHRTEAAAAWVTETFAEATTSGANAVVLFFHANPAFGRPPDHGYRQVYEPFLTVLERESERFAGPVLVAHGDNHDYLLDHPLVQRTTGQTLGNVTRLQVPGSPSVGWVRVLVTPGPDTRFMFEPRVVPSWKYW